MAHTAFGVSWKATIEWGRGLSVPPDVRDRLAVFLVTSGRRIAPL